MRKDMFIDMCIDMRKGMRIDMRKDMCSAVFRPCGMHRWKALVEAAQNEYRHVRTRAVDMPSAMADGYIDTHDAADDVAGVDAAED